MKYEIYANYIAADDLSIFDFESIGKRGSIKKRIAFMPTELDGVFNLAFGDVDEDGEVDFRISELEKCLKILCGVRFNSMSKKSFDGVLMYWKKNELVSGDLIT